jgi:hypothetical protein
LSSPRANLRHESRDAILKGLRELLVQLNSGLGRFAKRSLHVR